MQKALNQRSAPFYGTTDFWITGAALILALGIGVGSKIHNAEAAHQAAIESVRTDHPEVAWAFAEWDMCNRGEGEYAQRGYVTIEQCDMAVNALASKRGAQPAVKNALLLQNGAN